MLQRYFFALQPPPAVRAMLTPWLEQLEPMGVRAYHPADLHITLAFLGNCDSSKLQHACQQAQAIRSTAFPVVLDTVVYWPIPKVWVLTPSRAMHPAWQHLVEQLRSASVAAPDSVGLQYQPHMTVGRKAAAAAVLACPKLEWQAEHFGLFVGQSPTTGMRYRLLETWPLSLSV